MFANIAFGALLTASTVAVHALCTASLIAFLRAIHVDHWALRSVWTRVAVISALVVGMFLVSVVEAGLWAAVYVGLGAIPDFAEALYFSPDMACFFARAVGFVPGRRHGCFYIDDRPGRTQCPDPGYPCWPHGVNPHVWANLCRHTRSAYRYLSK